VGDIGQYDNGLDVDDEEKYTDYGNNNDNIFGDLDNEETPPNPSVERLKMSSLNNTASVHTTTTNNNRAPPKQYTNKNNNARNNYHSDLDNESIATFDTIPTYINTRRH